MSDFLDCLADQAAAERVELGAALDRALTDLDRWMEELAPQLEVEHYGPGVGIEGNADTFRLVVREHEWDRVRRGWGLKVCDGTVHGEWRPMWTVQGVARRRKTVLVRALPQLFDGYARAVDEAGKADTDAGRAIIDAARRLATDR